MAWTTPRTWATNDSLSASTLNTHVRDNLGFLYGAPRCRVYNSAVQSIPHGAFTAITFDSERFDNDSMHSTSVNTSRITFTTAGVYLVGGAVNFAVNATGVRGVGIRLNGATQVGFDSPMTRIDGGEPLVPASTIYSFAAGDYVELMAYQSSGGALNSTVNPNVAPEFWAVFQGG